MLMLGGSTNHVSRISLVQSATSSLPSTLVTRMHTHTRSESHAIPSPHHLSWLALDTYKALFHNEEVRYIPVAFFPVLYAFVACSTASSEGLGTRLRCGTSSETILSHYIMCRTVSLVTWRSWLSFVCCCTQLVGSPRSQLTLP